MHFNYHNVETKQHGGKKMLRRVSIKNGRGYKSVSVYSRGKHIKTVKKRIHSDHIDMIKGGKFIPGLFNDVK